MSDPENEPYRADHEDGRFRVLDGTGRVVLVCGDGNSATQYAVLLNEAYRRGYKAGYRTAKTP